MKRDLDLLSEQPQCVIPAKAGTQPPRVRAANDFFARMDMRALGGPLSRAMTHWA